MRTLHPELPEEPVGGRKTDRWVVVEVDEAYIHCRKNIPRMARVHERPGWDTDDPARKGGDYFGAKEDRAVRTRVEDASQTRYPIADEDGPATELTAPIPAQRPPDRSRFPSTTHLLTGAATARPLRGAVPPARAGRRIRWLSS